MSSTKGSPEAQIRGRHGTGYLHRAPSRLAKLSSDWRSRRIGDDFTPTVHPPFTRYFLQIGAMDQGGTNACTGYALTMGSMIMARSHEIDVPRLSPLLPYWAARCRDATDEALIQDSGAYVDDVVWAFNRFGAPTEDLLPFDSLTTRERRAVVNKPPPPAAFRNALAIRSRLKRAKLRPIVDTGDRLVLRAAHSLHKGQIVFAALPVSDAFMVALDPIPPQTPEGWHYVALLDWRYNERFELELLIGNSWSSYWGFKGTCWASSGLIQQALAIHYWG